jgi:hypothetical protein
MLPVSPLEVTKHLKAVRRLRLWEIHVNSKRVFHNPKVLIRLGRTGFCRNRKRIVEIDRYAVSIQCHLVVVNRRADEAARFVRAVVERMQRIDGRHQSVPGTAAYPFLLTLLIDSQEVGMSRNYIEDLRVWMAMHRNTDSGSQFHLIEAGGVSGVFSGNFPRQSSISNLDCPTFPRSYFFHAIAGSNCFQFLSPHHDLCEPFDLGPHFHHNRRGEALSIQKSHDVHDLITTKVALLGVLFLSCHQIASSLTEAVRTQGFRDTWVLSGLRANPEV